MATAAVLTQLMVQSPVAGLRHAPLPLPVQPASSMQPTPAQRQMNKALMVRPWYMHVYVHVHVYAVMHSLVCGGGGGCGAFTP